MKASLICFEVLMLQINWNPQPHPSLLWQRVRSYGGGQQKNGKFINWSSSPSASDTDWETPTVARIVTKCLPCNLSFQWWQKDNDVDGDSRRRRRRWRWRRRRWWTDRTPPRCPCSRPPTGVPPSPVFAPANPCNKSFKRCNNFFLNPAKFLKPCNNFFENQATIYFL